jgi:hypothetical protein
MATTRTLADHSGNLSLISASNIIGQQTRRAEVGFLLGTIFANFSSAAGASDSPYATILSSIGLTAATASVLISYAQSRGVI